MASEKLRQFWGYIVGIIVTLACLGVVNYFANEATENETNDWLYAFAIVFVYDFFIHQFLFAFLQFILVKIAKESEEGKTSCVRLLLLNEILVQVHSHFSMKNQIKI